MTVIFCRGFFLYFPYLMEVCAVLGSVNNAWFFGLIDSHTTDMLMLRSIKKFFELHCITKRIETVGNRSNNWWTACKKNVSKYPETLTKPHHAKSPKKYMKKDQFLPRSTRLDISTNMNTDIILITFAKENLLNLLLFSRKVFDFWLTVHNRRR